MAKFESPKISIDKSQHELFVFLADLRNFEDLVPKDITFSATEDTCSFGVSTMGTVEMKIAERKPYSQIQIKQVGKAPFAFTLYVEIVALGASKSEVQVTIDAAIPGMLSGFVSKPIQHLTNSLASRLGQKYMMN